MPDRPNAESCADDLGAAINEAMERAAMSGLCRGGQLEMAVQAARCLRPDLGEDALLALVEAETS